MELTKIIQISWGRFLQTDAGKDGLLFLHQQRPGISKGLPHEVQFDAGFTEGYRKCLENIVEMTHVETTSDRKEEND